MFCSTGRTLAITSAIALFSVSAVAADINENGEAAAPPKADGDRAPDQSSFSLDGFGGPMVRVSQIKGQLGFLNGGRGAGNLTDHFTLGGGGCGLVNSIRVPDATTGSKTYLMKLGYGGVELGYVFNPEDVVFLSANLLLAPGMVIRRVDAKDDSDGGGGTRFYWFFAVEPALYANIEVFSFMQINLGVAYRQLGGLHADWVATRDLNGFAGSVALLFGRKRVGASGAAGDGNKQE
jgi:hypothetical protein